MTKLAKLATKQENDLTDTIKLYLNYDGPLKQASRQARQEKIKSLEQQYEQQLRHNQLYHSHFQDIISLMLNHSPKQALTACRQLEKSEPKLAASFLPIQTMLSKLISLSALTKAAYEPQIGREIKLKLNRGSCRGILKKVGSSGLTMFQKMGKGIISKKLAFKEIALSERLNAIRSILNTPEEYLSAGIIEWQQHDVDTAMSYFANVAFMKQFFNLPQLFDLTDYLALDKEVKELLNKATADSRLQFSLAYTNLGQIQQQIDFLPNGLIKNRPAILQHSFKRWLELEPGEIVILDQHNKIWRVFSEKETNDKVLAFSSAPWVMFKNHGKINLWSSLIDYKPKWVNGCRHFMSAVKADCTKNGQNFRGRNFKKILGAHAPGRIHYQFDKPVVRFKAFFGLADGKYEGRKGNAVFQVMADGKSVFKSRPVRYGSPLQVVNVKFTPAKSITLITDANGSNHEDWCFWVRPEICFDDDEQDMPKQIQLSDRKHFLVSVRKNRDLNPKGQMVDRNLYWLRSGADHLNEPELEFAIPLGARLKTLASAGLRIYIPFVKGAGSKDPLYIYYNNILVGIAGKITSNTWLEIPLDTKVLNNLDSSVKLILKAGGNGKDGIAIATKVSGNGPRLRLCLKPNKVSPFPQSIKELDGAWRWNFQYAETTFLIKNGRNEGLDFTFSLNHQDKLLIAETPAGKHKAFLTLQKDGSWRGTEYPTNLKIICRKVNTDRLKVPPSLNFFDGGWTWSCNNKSRGKIFLKNGVRIDPHRLMWKMTLNGPILRVRLSKRKYTDLILQPDGAWVGQEVPTNFRIRFERQKD